MKNEQDKNKLSEVNCLICESQVTGTVFQLDDVTKPEAKVVYNYIECQNCKLIFQYPILNSKVLAESYNNQYYSYTEFNPSFFSKLRTSIIEFNIGKALPKSIISKILVCLLHKRFSNLLPEFYGGPDSTFMDVGCGNGENLKILKRFGWNVYGTEISNDVVNRLNSEGYKVWDGGIFEVPTTENNKIDALRLWHVLEHLENPLEGLRKCHSLMSKRGQLFGAVPNSDSFNRWLFRHNWIGYDAPRHTHVFNPQNLKKLLLKSGFNDIKIQYRTSNSFLDSLTIKINKKSQKNSYFLNNVVLMTMFFLIDISADFFKKGDVIFFQAKKIEQK